MSLTLEIVTPEGRVHSDTVDSVVIPTVQGEIGILPGHIPLLTQIENGELRVLKGPQSQSLAVSGGFVEVEGDRVSVLAEFAIKSEQIDEEVVKKAIERAETALKNKENLDPAEIRRLEGLLSFSMLEMTLKGRRP